MYYALWMVWIGLSLLFSYYVFGKMGLVAWKGLVPGYNLYVLCEEFYGNGWRVFMFLIPVYGVVLWVKLCLTWARGFGKSAGFGVGMALATPVFLGILALNDKVCYARNV